MYMLLLYMCSYGFCMHTIYLELVTLFFEITRSICTYNIKARRRTKRRYDDSFFFCILFQFFASQVLHLPRVKHIKGGDNINNNNQNHLLPIYYKQIGKNYIN